MTEQSDYLKRLKDLAQKSLLQIPPEMKKSLPIILSKSGVLPFIFMNDVYFILTFIDNAEKERLESLFANGEDPFPYLIRPKNVTRSVAIAMNNSRYGIIDNVAVKDMFSFSLGKDCSFILHSFKQIITIAENVSPYEYVIDLAYVISFGDEINKNNLQYFLEDLIAYSIKRWRASNDE